MSSDRNTVITCREIAKLYRLGRQRDFWALKDISFDVQRGEVVGIVGRNGAGKSTLLKIFSRITEPTEGVLGLKGSMSSLLEVGTGFHPELTGYENIFLNGAILGMKQSEIKRRFDEIVGFAELEKFIQTPVKRYSTGMYVRLAFAIAAHLNPDILVLDEVLAVGDALFQKKCLGAIKDLASQERTVLFVSHSLIAVRAFCSRVIVLDGGRVVFDGATDEGLAAYSRLLRQKTSLSSAALNDRRERCHGSNRVLFTSVRGFDSSHNESWTITAGEDFTLEVSYETCEDIPNLGIYVAIQSNISSEMLTNYKAPVSVSPMSKGRQGSFAVKMENVPLRPGEYSIYLSVGDYFTDKPYDVIDQNVDLPLLSIVPDERRIHGMMGYFSMPMQVIVSEGPALAKG